MASPNSNLTILLAKCQDAPELAAITTRAFKASDAIFPMIWGSTAPNAHDVAAMMLLNPIQSATKITWKVEIDGKILGYARWSLPVGAGMNGLETGESIDGNKREESCCSQGNSTSATAQLKQEVEGGWKTPAGMDFDLSMRKVNGAVECRKWDYNADVDIMLDLCFVDSAYHNRGIGNTLLEWGISKADRERRKICLASTPQAMRFTRGLVGSQKKTW